MFVLFLKSLLSIKSYNFYYLFVYKIVKLNDQNAVLLENNLIILTSQAVV